MRRYSSESVAVAPRLTVTLTWTSCGLSNIVLADPKRARSRAHVSLPPFIRDAIWLLRRYFQRDPVTFSQIPLDLAASTSFQRAVWTATRQIPWGQTRSYRWLAAHISRPTAVRAVGTALARNPLPIIIPCHRVIRSDGSLGGFGYGLLLKSQLLSLENVSLSQESSSTTFPPIQVPS